MNIGALIVWLLAMASGAAVFILTPDVWTLALAAGIVLVPLAGMAGAFAARKAVAVEVILPRGAEKGRDAVIAFRGTNGAWLPLPRVEFRFVMTNGLTGETRRETVRLPLPGRGTGETALTLHSGQCGLFRIQAECVRVCDPLGICRFTAVDDRHWELMVQPGLFAMELLLPMRGSVSEDSDRYAQDRAGYDLAETFQVREYAPGDSPRQIHWKLSSKLDRMIVRDPGLPLERSVLLLWERRGTPAAQESDAMAEVMAAVCQELLRQGVGCRAAWNGGGELTVQEVREPEGFYELLPRLLSAAPAGDSETVVELYRRLYGAEQGAKVIYVGTEDDPALADFCPPEHLVSLLCRPDAQGQGRVYTFGSGDYASRLAELELY